MELTGAIPRSEMRAQFEWADVFFLPSVCEGSATVIYEALMSGLPVVTTPNAGSLVRDGVDGYVVPIRDVDAMADRLGRLHTDHDLWQRMAGATHDSIDHASLDAYQLRLLHSLGLDSVPNS